LVQEIFDILNLQLRDNVKAKRLDENIRNMNKGVTETNEYRSQSDIYDYLKRKSK